MRTSSYELHALLVVLSQHARIARIVLGSSHKRRSQLPVLVWVLHVCESSHVGKSMEVRRRGVSHLGPGCDSRLVDRQLCLDLAALGATHLTILARFWTRRARRQV